MENTITSLPLISLASITQEPLSPVEWDVEDLIPHGDRVMVFAEWGAFKTWLGLHLSLHLVMGRAWLGKFTVPAARPVLYVDEELHERTMRRRIKRLWHGMGESDGSGDHPFRVLSRHGVVLNGDGAGKLLGALEISQFRPDVMVVDTYRRVVRGDENESRDVSAFWRAVEPICKANITLIVLHHMRKPKGGQEKTGHRASGSTDMVAGADSAFAVEKADTDAVVIEHVKSREGPEQESFVVTFDDGGDREGPMRLHYEGLAKDRVADELSRSATAGALIRDRLQRGPASTAEIHADLEAAGISRRTGERVLEAMNKAETITKPQRGLWTLAGASAKSSAMAERGGRNEGTEKEMGGSSAAISASIGMADGGSQAGGQA